MKDLLVSFSGGETSAYMAQWLWKNKKDQYNMVFVFANTGQENEETLEFVDKCTNYFGFPLVWVEAVPIFEERTGTGHKIVNYRTASRNGEPFEEVIKKYGIPNQSYPHCTRESKLAPIKSYVKSLGWDNYYTAIGIRYDEAGRISKSKYKNNIIYPLINKDMIPMTKPKINFWWSRQPFRLNLKGYQGNCKWCWKKGDKKLYKLAQEDVNNFDFPLNMEKKYSNFIPDSRIELAKKKGEKINTPITFFRRNRSAKDIINESKKIKVKVIDDAKNLNFQSTIFDNEDLIGGESCEIYAECGD